MFTSGEIAQWLSKGWKNETPFFQGLEISGISHDTRTLKPGEVYIAIKGATHDGHDFVQQAFQKGAVAAIVGSDGCPQPSSDASAKCPYLVVPDTMDALWKLASGYRATWSGTVIGITGSAGKTTVKEMLASVLAQKGTVAKTPGNWNNDIGLPLSMLAAGRHADFFVFELGMNHPGEINRLASLLRPDWALITNIGKAHIEFFPFDPAQGRQTLEKIADEKSAIFKHATHAVLDADGEFFERMGQQFDGLVTPLTSEKFAVNQPGAHMVQNARFAATLGLELGLSSEQVQKGLDSFEPAPMRWQTIKKDGVLFINDAYNANPLSMRAALSAFAELPCEGRKFAVLGAMRELGKASEEEHRELGIFVDTLGFHDVITIGEAGARIVCKGLGGVDKDTAVNELRDQLRAGDMVLLKASRGEKLETIFEDLKTRI